MTRKTKWIIVVIGLLLLTNILTLTGFLRSQESTGYKLPPLSPSPKVITSPIITAVLPGQTSEATVTSVTDGDTFRISTGQTVRMIGIDTPETVDPRKTVQCFGKDASAKTKELLLGKTVRLEKDVSETDRYGRLLRYVYVNEDFINQTLVRDGFAKASSYPPDVKYQSVFQLAEQEAREEGRGLWSSCLLSPAMQDEAENSSLDPTTSTQTNSGGQFTQSSEDKDCKDFSTQYEAQTYFNNKGGSSSNNVDRLDGSDGDGKVCETLP